VHVLVLGARTIVRRKRRKRQALGLMASLAKDLGTSGPRALVAAKRSSTSTCTWHEYVHEHVSWLLHREDDSDRRDQRPLAPWPRGVLGERSGREWPASARRRGAALGPWPHGVLGERSGRERPASGAAWRPSRT